MHDLVNTYRLQAVTTEDFKAIVEKHMSPQMDLDGNGKMDWFFNQYVYGTDLPVYHFEGHVTENAGVDSLHFKLTQSGVSPNFKMLVPIYLEFADGRVLRIGVGSRYRFENSGADSEYPQYYRVDKTRVSINYYYDVLSTEN